MQFILASQSPQRQNLIKSLPYDWQIQPADLDEQAVRFTSPQAKARNIAQAKASKISQQLTGDYLIIAADTFSLCRGKILEKPHNKAAAREMLEWQSGQLLKSLTGYAFWCYQNGRLVQRNGLVTVKAKFRQLTSGEIENYVAHHPVTTWSAAFSAAYDAGMALISRLDGNLTAFTHGLPIDLVAKFIETNLGVNNKHHR